MTSKTRELAVDGLVILAGALVLLIAAFACAGDAGAGDAGACDVDAPTACEPTGQPPTGCSCEDAGAP